MTHFAFIIGFIFGAYFLVRRTLWRQEFKPRHTIHGIGGIRSTVICLRAYHRMLNRSKSRDHNYVEIGFKQQLIFSLTRMALRNVLQSFVVRNISDPLIRLISRNFFHRYKRICLLFVA